MESFVVRIYRRDKGEIAGLVEVVEGGEKKNFTDINGLLCILAPDQGTGRGEAEAERE